MSSLNFVTNSFNQSATRLLPNLKEFRDVLFLSKQSNFIFEYPSGIQQFSVTEYFLCRFPNIRWIHERGGFAKLGRIACAMWIGLMALGSFHGRIAIHIYRDSSFLISSIQAIAAFSLAYTGFELISTSCNLERLGNLKFVADFKNMDFALLDLIFSTCIFALIYLGMNLLKSFFDARAEFLYLKEVNPYQQKFYLAKIEKSKNQYQVRVLANTWFDSPIHDACGRGDLDDVRQILRNDLRQLFVEMNRELPLQTAIRLDQVEIVKFIMKTFPKMESLYFPDYKLSLFEFALWWGKSDLALFFLQQVSDIRSLSSKSHKNVLFTALQFSDFKLTTYLIEHYPELIADIKEERVFQRLMEFNSYGKEWYLLFSISPDLMEKRDENGDTCLHHLAGKQTLTDDHKAILFLFAKLKENVFSIKNNLGQTPQDIALIYGREEFLRTIKAFAPMILMKQILLGRVRIGENSTSLERFLGNSLFDLNVIRVIFSYYSLNPLPHFYNEMAELDQMAQRVKTKIKRESLKGPVLSLGC